MQTIKGLRAEAVFERVTAALVNAGALQCGDCTPGIASTLTAELRNNPAATAQELEQALQGNLCRCTGYTDLRQAVAKLVRT